MSRPTLILVLLLSVCTVALVGAGNSETKTTTEQGGASLDPQASNQSAELHAQSR